MRDLRPVFYRIYNNRFTPNTPVCTDRVAMLYLQVMLRVLAIFALQLGVCLPLEAKLDVVSRILHEVPLIDG